MKFGVTSDQSKSVYAQIFHIPQSFFLLSKLYGILKKEIRESKWRIEEEAY